MGSRSDWCVMWRRREQRSIDRSVDRTRRVHGVQGFPNKRKHVTYTQTDVFLFIWPTEVKWKERKKKRKKNSWISHFVFFWFMVLNYRDRSADNGGFHKRWGIWSWSGTSERQTGIWVGCCTLSLLRSSCPRRWLGCHSSSPPEWSFLLRTFPSPFFFKVRTLHGKTLIRAVLLLHACRYS